jgi:hypothetical protein
MNSVPGELYSSVVDLQQCAPTHSSQILEVFSAQNRLLGSGNKSEGIELSK